MRVGFPLPVRRRGKLDSDWASFEAPLASVCFLVEPEWFRTRTTERRFALPGEFGSELADKPAGPFVRGFPLANGFCW